MSAFVNPFRPAIPLEKERVALVGCSGSGKSFTALQLAGALGGKVALLDLEACPTPTSIPYERLEVTSYEGVIRGIEAARQAGYGVLVLDCLSTLYKGPGGLLSLLDLHGDKKGWEVIGKRCADLYAALRSYPGHVIVTVRAEELRLVEQGPEGTQRVRLACGKVDFRPDFGAHFSTLFELSQGLATCTKGKPAIYQKTWSFPGAELARLLLPSISGSQVSQPAPEVISPQEAAPETPAHPSTTGTSTPPSVPKTAGPKPENEGQWTIRRLRELAQMVARQGVTPDSIREVFSRNAGEFDEQGRLKAMPEARYEMAAGELQALGMAAQEAAETPWDSRVQR